MPVYHYQAVGKDGKKKRGKMQAEDETDLYVRLLREEQYLTRARKAKPRTVRYSLNSRELSRFSGELGTMLKAGIPLAKVFAILDEEEGASRKQAVYRQVMERIRQGMSLSEAMEEQKGAFPPLMVSLFCAAERSGGLDRAALQMEEHYRREYQLNAKVKSAMVYPKILAVLLVLVTGFLTGVILPQFEELFSLAGELPLPTRILYGIIGFVEADWRLLCACGFFLLVLSGFAGQFALVKRWRDKQKLRAPFFGNIRRTVYTARFARSLSSLYGAGIPAEEALQLARKTIGNAYIEAQFDQVIALVRGGSLLSEALEPVDGFLARLLFAVKVGEEAGSLDTMLASMADSLEYDAQIALARQVAYLEPAMIIVMAAVVGFIMIAVMMPIYQSYQAMSSYQPYGGTGMRE